MYPVCFLCPIRTVNNNFAFPARNQWMGATEMHDFHRIDLNDSYFESTCRLCTSKLFDAVSKKKHWNSTNKGSRFAKERITLLVDSWIFHDTIASAIQLEGDIVAGHWNQKETDMFVTSRTFNGNFRNARTMRASILIRKLLCRRVVEHAFGCCRRRIYILCHRNTVKVFRESLN